MDRRGKELLTWHRGSARVVGMYFETRTTFSAALGHVKRIVRVQW